MREKNDFKMNQTKQFKIHQTFLSSDSNLTFLFSSQPLPTLNPWARQAAADDRRRRRRCCLALVAFVAIFVVYCLVDPKNAARMAAQIEGRDDGPRLPRLFP